MEKIVERLIKFYPLENVSMNRRVKIHIMFWLLWGVVLFFSTIPGSSFGYRLWVSCFTISISIFIYYSLTYFILEKILNHKLGFLYVFILYFVIWLINYVAYALNLKFNLSINSKVLSYFQRYVSAGWGGLFLLKDLLFQLFTAFYGTAPAFLIKLGRLFAVFNTKSIRLESEKKEIELNFLRLQLNPHFLLNTLNNIYSQVISQEENAANSIITLADLLNYILYEANTEQVSMKKEIRFIRDYIDLEKMRSSADLKINFEVEGNTKGYVIAPLILISFIENAFKHGVGDSTITSMIDVNMKINTQTDSFLFIVKNTKPRISKNLYLTQKGGIGIENTRKRLQMLYPNAHQLTIDNTATFFLVTLSLQLDKND
jgi:two-component system, LytTR family, sensor kinase